MHTAQRALTGPQRFSLRRWVLTRSSNSGKEASAGCELFPWRQAVLPQPSKKKKSVSLSGAVDRGRAKAQPTGPFPLPSLRLFPNLTMHLPYIISICSIFQPLSHFRCSPHPRPRPIPASASSPLTRSNRRRVIYPHHGRAVKKIKRKEKKPPGCAVQTVGAL